MLLADLMGRVGAAEELGVIARMAEPMRRLGPYLLAAAVWAAFADAPIRPQQAIAALKGRLAMTPDEFYDLEQRYRQKGFAIASVQSKDLLEKVQAELVKALRGGVSEREFIAEMPALFERFGVTATSRSHIETVFRSNMASSYNAGRWQMQTDPDVKHLFRWRYDAVDDDRTRPEHAAMDGVTRPPDDPIWQNWYPPNGYNCRCRVIAVPVAEAKLTPSGKIPHASPDAGWSGNPGDWLG